ncbi:MAG TPA: AgmX/PglI C-terminal domain-containing protein [Polyangia bacterium]|nr:AgmX/PglI C-terminal domain-containing protein [Polyangia bacterium]
MTPQLLMLMALAGAGSHGSASVDGACAAAARGAGAEVHVFAETSGAVLPKAREGEWRELGNEAELKSLADGEKPPNTEAVVRKTRAATLVSMYFQDATGDWAHVVDYCFRPEGSLARVKGTFNSYTAAGPGKPGVRRRRTAYYDDAGNVVRFQSRAFTLDTDKPLGEVEFTDAADPLYPNVRALPFWGSLAPAQEAAPLDPDGAVATVREHVPAIKACYERALHKTPNLAGKIVARWTIDGAGKVSAFGWQTDEMHSAAFNACAKRLIESLRFPPAKGGSVTVSFPFVFDNADAKVSSLTDQR